MKKKKNSNIKGKRGEREWAKFCKKFGFDVRRTQQYCGKHDPNAADCIGLPHIHQEIKRVEVENFRIYDAYEQSANEALVKYTKNTGLLIPIVAHRKNRGKWLVTMDAYYWFQFYQSYLAKLETQGKCGKRENDEQ